MFEKCGLRDIFAKIWKMKWVILIILVIFAGIGASSYMKDVKTAEAKAAKEEANNRKIYAGYAYYYINYTKEGTSATDSIMKSTATSYIRTMGLYPTRSAIFNTLKENHSKDELTELLGSSVYPKGVTRFSIKKSYTVSRDTSPFLLKIRVTADDSDMCKELLKACRAKLVKIDEGIVNSSLKYEGSYVAAENSNANQKSVEEEQESSTTSTTALTDKEEEDGPSIKTIIVWLIIGLVIGLILAVICALLWPVLNRASDFEDYGTLPIGEADKKSIPIFVRLLNKRLETENVKKIVFATSRTKDNRIEELCRQIAEEWKKLGKDVCFGEGENDSVAIQVAYAPDRNGEASDLCEAADMVIAAEKKGASLHRRYDEMLHYLGLFEIKPAGAVLFH